MQQTYPVSMLEAMSKGPDLDLIAAACVCVGAGDWECHTLTRATKRIAAECLSFFDALANEHQIQSLLLHGAQQTASDHHVCQSPDMLTSHKTEDACQLDLLRGGWPIASQMGEGPGELPFQQDHMFDIFLTQVESRYKLQQEP